MLQVSDRDLKEIQFAKRQNLLERVALVLAPAVAAILGILAGSAAVPVVERPSPYPLGSLVAAGPAVSMSARRSWLATALISVLLFILAFTLIAWINSGMNSSYGGVPRYSVFKKGG